MSDSQLNLESKTKMGVAKAQNYIGGDTAQKIVNWEGGTPHILSYGGNNLGGKKHILGGGDRDAAHTLLMGELIGEYQSRLTAGWLDCWLAGSVSDYSTTSWLHFAS